MSLTGAAVVSLCIGGVALAMLAFLWACGRAD
jgi:hypothetical protein